MTENTGTTPIPLSEFAKQFGETSLAPAESLKTKVFIGEKVIFKLSEQKGMKEEYVLKLLADKLSERWQPVIPHIVGAEEIEGLGTVQVHTKLKGKHPKEITKQLAADLGQFLSALHNAKVWDKITEFEGDEGVSFVDYLITSSKKFLTKLEDIVDISDSELINKAVDSIEKYADKISVGPELVLIHKDLHLDNLLVGDSGELTGIIDWGAAQAGPREWEFAILKQRMPEDWQEILASYTGGPLDPGLLDVCGLIQSLRFWKSFPDDEPFVAEQREYIKMILASQ